MAGDDIGLQSSCSVYFPTFLFSYISSFVLSLFAILHFLFLPFFLFFSSFLSFFFPFFLFHFFFFPYALSSVFRPHCILTYLHVNSFFFPYLFFLRILSLSFLLLLFPFYLPFFLSLFLNLLLFFLISSSFRRCFILHLLAMSIQSWRLKYIHHRIP